MLSQAQAERLAACARVLDPPARIAMTGRVAAEALAAVTGAARPGVEVLALAPGEVALVDAPIDMLFVGSAGRYRTAVEMFQRWTARVVPGGTLFVHGAFAEPSLTAALLRTVGASRAWRYFGRDGMLAEYVRADLAIGERVLDAIAQLAQTPSFVRTLARRSRQT